MREYDIAIIGGGVLGVCISYWISSMYEARVAVLEKESGVAFHATGRNTGVVHTPFYLNPESRGAQASSAASSYILWEDLAARKNIPWKKTGMLELASDEFQHARLAEYVKWGKKNGVPDGTLELLDSEQVRKLEPHIRCHSAILSDMEVSTDYALLCGAVRDESQKSGTDFLMNAKVVAVRHADEGLEIDTANGAHIHSKFVINCAGGSSLRVAQMLGVAMKYSEMHFRGEYWLADSGHAGLVNTTVYTVPEFAGYPFLDPHWVRRADGGAEVGPNAVPVLGPEAYTGLLGGASLASLADLLVTGVKRIADPEFLTLASKEWLSSISKRAMIGRLRKFIPDIRPSFFSKRGTAGIRSPLISPDGRFVSDALELEGKDSFSILNYNSPGATGAPAYSKDVASRLRTLGVLDYKEKQGTIMWRTDQG